MELYKEKLNERELYEKNNMFDYFGREGAGAPLRSDDGRIRTKRRTMLNDNYEELTMNNDKQNQNIRDNTNYYNQFQEQYQKQIQAQPIPQAYGQNYGQQPNNDNFGVGNVPLTQQVNQLQQQYAQPSIPPQPQVQLPQQNMYYTQRNNYSPYQQIQQYNQENMKNINNDYANFGRRTPNINVYQPQPQQIPSQQGNYHMQNSNMQSNINNYRNVQSARSAITPMRNENMNQDVNFNEVKIFPTEHPNVKLEVQKKMLREDWLKQIDEKKKRLQEERMKQLEKDRIEEEKWQKYLEEQKENERMQREAKLQQQQNIFNSTPVQNNSPNVQAPPNKSVTPASFSNRAEHSNSDNIGDNLSQNFQLLKTSRTPNQQQQTSFQVPNFNYAQISKNLDDTINEQIAKLRTDVNMQYVEMSNLFGKLKMDVAEANQLKNEAEKELKYIRDELLKAKMNNILYENKLNQVLEKNAPYNNLHIPFNEVDPFNGANNKYGQGKNLQSTSSMVYANDMVNEGNINRVRELSALAQVGQSLVGESEFIPIQTSNEERGELKNISNMNMNTSGNGDDPGIGTMESTKILDDYMKKGDYHEMYSKLVDIANLNHQMNPEAKCRTIGKNLEVDYNSINNKNSQKEEIKKLDDMLKDIVDNTNK